MKFGMEAFRFLGDYQYVYVHCEVIVCHTSQSDSRCSKGCLRGTRRKRQQAADDESFFGGSTKLTLSQGPFTREPGSKPSPQPGTTRSKNRTEQLSSTLSKLEYVTSWQAVNEDVTYCRQSTFDILGRSTSIIYAIICRTKSPRLWLGGLHLFLTNWARHCWFWDRCMAELVKSGLCTRPYTWLCIECH